MTENFEYKREIMPGDLIQVRTCLINFTPKSLHVWGVMIDAATDEICAINDQVCVSMDSIARKAARFAARYADRTRSFVFAHGLTGLGGLPAADRDRAKAGRLEVFHALGPLRFAHEKGPAIMSPSVSDDAREKAVAIMAKIKPAGFCQAVEMLAAADFFADKSSVSSFMIAHSFALPSKPKPGRSGATTR